VLRRPIVRTRTSTTPVWMGSVRIRFVFTCKVWRIRFAGFCHDCPRRTSYASVMLKQAWHYVRLNRKFQKCSSKLGISFAAPEFRFAVFCHDCPRRTSYASVMLKQAWHYVRLNRKFQKCSSSLAFRSLLQNFASQDSVTTQKCSSKLGISFAAPESRLLHVGCNGGSCRRASYVSGAEVLQRSETIAPTRGLQRSMDNMQRKCTRPQNAPGLPSA